MTRFDSESCTSIRGIQVVRRRVEVAAERRRESVLRKEAAVSLNALPSLETIYDTIPIGLAFLTPDCRYLQINQRMTEICGISVEDHLGRTVRETLPRLADQVEDAVRHIVSTGKSITGIEVSGEQPDAAEGRGFGSRVGSP